MSTPVTTLITAAMREGNLIPVGTTPTTAEQAEALDRLNAMIMGVYGYEMGEELSDWDAPAPQRTSPVAANYPQLPYPQGLDGNMLALPVGYDPPLDIWQNPPKNSRIVFGGGATGSTTTCYFPEAPEDGTRMAVVQGSGAGDQGVAGSTLTLDGNGRTIEGSNTQSYNDPVAPRSWLYRADLGNWTAVLPLVLVGADNVTTSQNCPFPSELDDVWVCGLAIRLAPRYGKTAAQETIGAMTQAIKRLKARYRQAGTTIYNSQEFPRSLQSYLSGRWFW